MRIKINKTTSRIWAALLALILLTFCTSLTILAAEVDTGAKTSLTADYHYEDTALWGVTVELYRVGDIDAGGALSWSERVYSYGLVPERTGANTSDWDVLACNLADYLRRDSVKPIKTDVTGVDGTVSFEELETGLYLGVAQQTLIGGYRYTFQPFLTALPCPSDNGQTWDYDVTVTPKVDRETIPDEPVSRRALKAWKDDGNEAARPKSVTVQLLRDGTVYDTHELNAENEWRYAWDGLDAACEWTLVEEQVPEGYTATVTKEGTAFVVTNTQVVPKSGEVTVRKAWKDNDDKAGKRPDYVQVRLYRDGKTYGDVITLNEENSWTYTWKDLPEGAEWSVDEVTVPESYTKTVTGTKTSYTITNTYVEPKLPQTGLLWWPVPVLIIGGLAFVLTGILVRRGEKGKHE